MSMSAELAGALSGIAGIIGYAIGRWRKSKGTPPKIEEDPPAAGHDSGPYRTADTPDLRDLLNGAPMPEPPRKVVCQGCKHLHRKYGSASSDRPDFLCLAHPTPDKANSPIHGGPVYFERPHDINKNFDCTKWEAK